MRKSLRSFRKNEDGSATIEFVAVFFFFMTILTFVIEVAIFMFFQTTLEKAAEAGVRIAVVSPSVIPLPQEIAPNMARPANGVRGQECQPDEDDDENPCIPIFGDIGAQRSCGLNAASPCGASIQRIVAEMRRFNGNITASNVRVTYTDLGIGFAGGPPVPMVTVTVDGVAFQSAILGLLLDWGGGNRSAQFAFMPPRSASLTGESLGP